MTPLQKTFIGIAIAVAVFFILIIGAGFWVEKKAQTFFYPVAPPMPAVVSGPMPEILAHLESVLKTNAPRILAGLQPGISAERIGRLEQKYNVQIPDDIKAIYEWHDGVKAGTNYFGVSPNTNADFIPGHHFESLEDALEENKAVRDLADKVEHGSSPPAERTFYHLAEGRLNNWYRLLDDGAGDGYFYDPTRKPAEGAVFSTVTEEGSFFFFPSAKNLMAGIAKCYEQGAYRVKTNDSRLQLDEDSDQSSKIWAKFGASNQEPPSSD